MNKENSTMENRILLQRKKSGGGNEGFISIYKVKEQFVTWKSDVETPDDTYWGHYFNDLVAAVDDYKKRT